MNEPVRCQRATQELSRMTAMTPSNCGEVHCETFSPEFFIWKSEGAKRE